MNKPFSLKKQVLSLIIALLLSIASTNAASADNGNPPQPPPTPVVIRQGGPVIHTESALPVGDLLVAAASVYRAGWTDAYWVFYPWPPKWEHHGSHNSQSDLVEDNIWVDGSLKVQSIVVDSCSNHTSGQYAQCGTDKTYYWKYTIVATSWHYFHKSGWVDQNFSTSKTINP